MLHFNQISDLYNKFMLILESNKIDNINDYTFVKNLGGSTGADLYKSPNGELYVIKSGNNTKQLYNEYMANKIYSDFGIDTPKMFLSELNNKPVIVMEYLADSQALGDYLNDDKILSDVSKGFILDVLLANWDVVGTNYDLDNIRVKDGKVYRVDLGGTLTTRAQGADKNFAYKPTEHNTLRDFAINSNTAEVFSELDDLKIKEQIDSLIKEYVVDNNIDWDKLSEKFRNIIYDESVKISKSEKDELIKTLMERIKELYKIFN